MIKYISGDILLSEAEAMAHGVSPNDDFKQGLALSLREMWPAMYKDFRHYCKTTSPSEGELWTWKGPGGPFIFNLFTQAAPRSQGTPPGRASETNVSHSLKNLVKTLEKENIKKLAITKVATGVGGLNWNDVKPIIEKYFSDSDIQVYVYEDFKKDVKAVEA